MRRKSLCRLVSRSNKPPKSGSLRQTLKCEKSDLGVLSIVVWRERERVYDEIDEHMAHLHLWFTMTQNRRFRLSSAPSGLRFARSQEIVERLAEQSKLTRLEAWKVNEISRDGRKVKQTNKRICERRNIGRRKLVPFLFLQAVNNRIASSSSYLILAICSSRLNLIKVMKLVSTI